MTRFGSIAAAASLALALASPPLGAQTVDPAFAGNYSLTNLGSASGVPTTYGGLFILPSQPDTLYIGGAANGAGGGLYAVPLARDGSGFITGFAGPGVRVADAPYNDGGMAPDPGGLVSYGEWPVNMYAQIDLTTGTVVNEVDLSTLGIASSASSTLFIPAGYPGAGGMRIAVYDTGQFYRVNYSVGAGGVITPNSATEIVGSHFDSSVGPEGWAYVPFGSPQFSSPTMIISEYGNDVVAVYTMDSNGNPIIASRQVFVSGLSGAEGAAIDPVSGSFLFSTFGGANQVIVVTGFAPPQPPPPPATTIPVPANSTFGVALLALIVGALGFALLNRRRSLR